MGLVSAVWFDVIQGLSEASSIEELEEMSRIVKVARSWRVVRCNRGCQRPQSIEEFEEMSRIVTLTRSWRVVRCDTRAVRGLKALKSLKR